jgi:hypothetical protein
MTNQFPSTTNITFFNAQTANGDSASYSFIFPMKRACLKYWGVWGGASIEFQTIVPPINGASVGYYVPIMFITGQDMFSADGQVTLENVVYGDLVRCVLSGATGTTSINVTAQVI